ncbi:MAG TPA: UDP-N-acetylmuramoyl-L-alanyl-D-glutamate--2,6-diaminopimelate ligase [Thermoanaerobaculia bacterium]|nr:UDP-N-acetylmuramoyl-L-alanyl-D-glutamate--2,6-diaminopimelate ligase [Thermoanaerobaculia bacterium]
MDLAAVLPGAEIVPPAGRLEVVRATSDSRQVEPGDLFFALRGDKADGLAHVPEAVERGAVAVVSDRPAPSGVSVPWLAVDAPRRALALASARLNGDPAEKLVLAGVTGTNGKTSTAQLLEAILAKRYGSAGFLGTIGYRTPRRTIEADRTTPEAPVIQRLLAEMVEDGARAAAMEVSSHALSLERIDGCRFDVVVFTNLTRDHLDFHGDMESYFLAKRRLFALRKPGAFGVVNADDPYGRRLLGEAAAPLASFSASGGDADFRAVDVRCDLSGVSFELASARGSMRIVSPLLGRFQASNLAGAATAALCLGVPASDVAAAVAGVTNVPGRLERVEAGQSYPIVVDYAHTPDALERLLSAVRELTDRKIVLVFGCGGDRDRGKRAPMGEIAGRLADIAVATSDNPRSEDPEAILREVEQGLVASLATKYLKIVDRREAIRQALDLANPGTVVVIAGKGHETTQVVGATAFPFDDRRVAAELAGRR